MGSAETHSDQVTVGTTATLVATAKNGQADVTIKAPNGLTDNVFVGGEDVTTSTGLQLAPGEQLTQRLRHGKSIHAVGTVSVTAHVLVTVE